MLQELTLRDAACRTRTSLALYQVAFSEVELSKYPIHPPPADPEPLAEEDPIPSPPPSPVLGVPVDDEGLRVMMRNRRTSAWE